MEITVFLEPISTNGFRATSAAPTPLVAEAPTREEALAQLSQMVVARLAHGEVVQLSVPLPPRPHPWKAIFGKLRDHPDAAEVEQSIRDYRRQATFDLDQP